MTEAELRALVRETIAQHLGSPAAAAAPGPTVLAAVAQRAVGNGAALVAGHMSHALFVLPAGDGACLIEPAVPCNHCGFCKSYGH